MGNFKTPEWQPNARASRYCELPSRRFLMALACWWEDIAELDQVADRINRLCC